MTLGHSVRTFTALETSAQLDELVTQSKERPILIFKHSPACGTSAEAYDELETYLRDDDAVDVHVVNVLSHRSCSQAIAARFAVRHESPQLLLLCDGQVRWQGSHWRVNAETVRAAVATARGASTTRQ